MAYLQNGAILGGLIGLAIVVALIAARGRFGVLNAASWLVIWGALVLLVEHPQFAISYAASLSSEEAPMMIVPHARIHFFMSGVYAIVGLALLCVIARTLLREGRRIGWYSVLFALLLGGGADLVTGGLWFQHGSPLYSLVGEHPNGWGWEFLYNYLVAWAAALVLSFEPIFRKSTAPRAVQVSAQIRT